MRTFTEEDVQTMGRGRLCFIGHTAEETLHLLGAYGDFENMVPNEVVEFVLENGQRLFCRYVEDVPCPRTKYGQRVAPFFSDRIEN